MKRWAWAGLVVLLLAGTAHAQTFITYTSPLPVGSGGTGSTLGGLVAGSAATIGFASTSAGGGTCDTCLIRDAANTLSLQNGTNGQTFIVYNTSSSSNANYERVRLGQTSNVFELLVEAAGTGAGRNLRIGTSPSASNAIIFTTGGTDRWNVTSSGHLVPITNNAVNVGSAALAAATVFSINLDIVSGGSTTISTGTGTVKMSSINNANNAAWIPIQLAGTTYFVPGWTTNSP